MALKPDRHYDYDVIQYFMNETAERGGVVIHDVSTSGVGGLDDAGSLVKKPTDSGGVPVGVLMCDVVDVDLSRYRLNEHRDEVQKNSKVSIMKRGRVRTNMIVADVQPVAGSGAYFTTSGYFTTAAGGTYALVGRFDSSKDEDGYAGVEVNLP